ncbi:MULTISPECIES: hypothetical protein [unclassified Paenarthrobacter]|uniref:hypothetical protein n=1 Tax=unclassified Paenarthrobacter TaxID=2634190 RepID=UPI00084E4D5D|nr:hypothetical protein [Paenarthrobacter sp. R1]NKR10605.1 hypothetical protein [Arthrobacter sp. M5]NKR16445.1 hypothetical protein [Arthrobacter sp. M6]OEH61443.1 hypothetical protein A5N13_17030 [Arthrobacter sp. D4]OEH64429.1 hypothetical protein A5N17_06425 [Arthrobacter sp. D2]WIV29213.1 hypothetical protein QN084_12585 [Paenarthrobacter sp. R1]
MRKSPDLKVNAGSNTGQPETVTGAGTLRGPLTSTVAEDLVAAVLGLVIVTAVYFDGRAHILGLPDSFFTPWHAFLYGGLLLLLAPGCFWQVASGTWFGTRYLVWNRESTRC